MELINVIELFVPLFKSLNEGVEYYPFNNLGICCASSFGKAKKIYLHKPVGNFPEFGSLIESNWQISKCGVVELAEHPYPKNTFEPELFKEIPKVKLIFDSSNIIFSMFLDKNWYLKLKGSYNKESLYSLVDVKVK